MAVTVAKGTKVPVSERALIQRINRKLRADDEMIRTSRWIHSDRGGFYEDHNTGRFFIVDFRENLMCKSHVDIEELGHELGALKAWEELASED